MLLSSIRYWLLAAILLFVACESKEKAADKPVASISASISDTAQARLDVRQLMRNVLLWDEDAKNFIVQPLVYSDDTSQVCIGINFEEHENNKVNLRETGYFTETFIANYDRIIKKLDENIKANAYGPFTQGMAPWAWGGGGRPFCECQDNWDYNTVEITVDKQEPKRITFRWYYGANAIQGQSQSGIMGGPSIAVKEGSKWKIDSMPAFDFEAATWVDPALTQ